jgi:hypothetical protein
MTALRQPGSDFLNMCLCAAVGCRNAAHPKHRDLHQAPSGAPTGHLNPHTLVADCIPADSARSQHLFIDPKEVLRAAIPREPSSPVLGGFRIVVTRYELDPFLNGPGVVEVYECHTYGRSDLTQGRDVARHDWSTRSERFDHCDTESLAS